MFYSHRKSLYVVDVDKEDDRDQQTCHDTKYCLYCPMVFYVTCGNFSITYVPVNKFTNIVISSYFQVHPLYKTMHALHGC